MKKVYLVSVSGGKDSQAAANFMLKNYPKDQLVFYFCDTGWEADETYQHIAYLEKAWGVKIHRVASEKYDGFEDLCEKRKGFPTRQGRFCTIELKLIPSINLIKSYKDAGYKVVNVVGVRADESKTKKLKKQKIINGVVWWIQPARDVENVWKSVFMGEGLPKSKKAIKQYYTKENAVTTYQPVVYWSARDVLEYNILSGTKNNPLYAKGHTRVGCMPCIMANNLEVGLLQDFHIARIKELEARVSSASNLNDGDKPTFFQNKSKDGRKQQIDEYARKRAYNTLGFELGCINQFGVCE